MSRAFVLSRSASQDLDDILEHVLENSGPGRAHRVHSALDDAFSKLAAQPNLGHTREDLADELLRVWTVYPYLIIYLPETKPLQILRVIHGARDLPSALEEED